MPASVYNFTIEQGTTFVQDFFWTVNGAYRDLTGYTARLEVRSAVKAPDPPLAHWSTLNGRIQMGSTDGRFTIFLRDTDTSSIQWSQGVYDLELIAPGATPIVIRLLKGTITIDPEVTTNPT